MITKRLPFLPLSLLIVVGFMVTACSRGATPDSPEPTTAPLAQTDPTATLPATAAPSPLQMGLSIVADVVVQTAHPPLALAFETSGKVATLHVAVGDQVQSGDLIASLDDTEAQAQMEQALLNVLRDEVALDELKRGADSAALATAQANLASARANLTALVNPSRGQELLAARQNLYGAQQALQDLLNRPDPNQIQIAKANLTAVEIELKSAQSAYNRIKWRNDVGMTPEAANLQSATVNHERALAEYNQATKGASESEIANARAQVAQAQANLDTLEGGPDADALAAAEFQVEQAQAALDELLNGASAKDLGTAEINVAQSRLALASAQRGLERVELIAPASGTVTEILVAPGAQVGSGTPVATLLDTTQLELYTTNLSERDFAQITPGQAAEVILKAYPDDVIAATVVRIGATAGAEVVGDAATFPIVLVLNETPLDVRPGMTGRVEIGSGE